MVFFKKLLLTDDICRKKLFSNICWFFQFWDKVRSDTIGFFLLVWLLFFYSFETSVFRKYSLGCYSVFFKFKKYSFSIYTVFVIFWEITRLKLFVFKKSTRFAFTGFLGVFHKLHGLFFAFSSQPNFRFKKSYTSVFLLLKSIFQSSQRVFLLSWVYSLTFLIIRMLRFLACFCYTKPLVSYHTIKCIKS